MSRTNVEIVRRVYDAAARRDRATVLALYDPEVELDLSRIPLAGLTGQGIYRGHEGLRSMFRDWYEAFQPYEEDCEEQIDTGEHVISVVTGRGRGRASGTDVEHPSCSSGRSVKAESSAWSGFQRVRKPSKPWNARSNDVAANVELVRSIFAALPVCEDRAREV